MQAFNSFWVRKLPIIIERFLDMSDRQLLWDRPCMEPSQHDTHVIEGVGVLDAT
jgi:hypothetical protein